jgi:hypothetical protein
MERLGKKKSFPIMYVVVATDVATRTKLKSLK